MEQALWFAGILGPFLAILGFWMLFCPEKVEKVMSSAKSTPSVLFLTGILNLLLGLFILREFHVWSMHLSVLVTLFGYFMLVRGILVFFFPQVVIKKTMHMEGMMRYMGLIPFVWGLALVWYAYL